MGFSEEASAQLQLIRQHLLADFASIETFMVSDPSLVYTPNQSTLTIPPATVYAAEPCEERHYRGVKRRSWGKFAAENRNPHKKGAQLANRIPPYQRIIRFRGKGEEAKRREKKEKRVKLECQVVKREELMEEAPKEAVAVSATSSNWTGVGDSEDKNETFGGPLLSPLSPHPWFGLEVI
ncbi:hypothetical protein F3Y22_tig00113722pilonHSYRG00394 [Hibiscus syriacus]|uniref:AP2/ERF domain-containing protein n=1 Tax=Hibiscus syriacus TaxID=106335 RepID=A0A6A2WND9_HIBSY|nr:hypothetical protein F3Y22_tig00113722pilonHSYRG00394 [Hibiscus syriacus]